MIYRNIHSILQEENIKYLLFRVLYFRFFLAKCKFVDNGEKERYSRDKEMHTSVENK